MDKSEVLVGGFLIVGAALVCVSVLASRLEGPQEISLTGAKFTLAAIVRRAEQEARAGELTPLEDLTS